MTPCAKTREPIRRRSEGIETKGWSGSLELVNQREDVPVIASHDVAIQRRSGVADTALLLADRRRRLKDLRDLVVQLRYSDYGAMMPLTGEAHDAVVEDTLGVGLGATLLVLTAGRS